MNTCFRCHKNGSCDRLDRHHIFGGPLRKKSEQYGLVVYLCHSECHIDGPESAHKNRETMLDIKRYGQQKAMEENGWTAEQFIREFGKNYL